MLCRRPTCGLGPTSAVAGDPAPSAAPPSPLVGRGGEDERGVGAEGSIYEDVAAAMLRSGVSMVVLPCTAQLQGLDDDLATHVLVATIAGTQTWVCPNDSLGAVR